MASEGPQEVLRPMILRSVTPASNEKVLHYLEGIEAAGETEDPEQYFDDKQSEASFGRPLSPRSQTQAMRSPPPPRSQASGLHENYAPPKAVEEDAESFDSNEQIKSEVNEEVPTHEPGPNDAPGPHYESFSSWGNKGILPLDDSSPVRVPYRPPNHENHWTNGYRTEQNGALMTPQTFDVPLESASSPSGSRRHPARSQNTESVVSTEKAMSPSPKKAPSHVDTQSPRSRMDVAPLSPPMSPTSPTARSHVTSRTKGTVYPPLPESRMGDNDSGMMSPKFSKTRSKAASVSPSDSASVAKVAPQMTGRTSASRRAPSHLNKSQVAGDGPADAAMLSPRSGTRQLAQNGSRSPQPASTSGGHQSRPFSPYRHAPTQEDLLHAAARGRALFIPEDAPVEEEQAVTESTASEVSRTRSHAKTASQVSKSPSKAASKVPSEARSQMQKTHSQVSRTHSHASKSLSQAGSEMTQKSRASKTHTRVQSDKTATARALSPEQLDEAEARLVEDVLASVGRTSFYAPSALESDVKRTPYHDVELCVLFHQLNDDNVHELVKKAVRKAVRQRVKRLGMKYDNESIKEYVQTHQRHDPSTHEQSHILDADEPPKWASDIKREIVLMQQRIESLGPKIENLRSGSQGLPEGSYRGGEAAGYYEDEEYEQTPQTQTINIQTQPTGTLAESLYQPPQTEMEDDELGDDQEFEEDQPETPKPAFNQSVLAGDLRDDSPGQQLLEEELYKLRQRKTDGNSHRSWELGRTDDERSFEEHGGDVVPTIPGSDAEGYDQERRVDSPPLPPLPGPDGQVASTGWNGDAETGIETQPWQKIHARLLEWAVIWQVDYLDAALNSTLRGNQVNELALSVWTAQTYKRYVRSKLTDSPQGVVDRLFVPPHMADAISTCVFNGRHGEACGMLRQLWQPFGLEGMPRLLVVLAKHRTDENHWVVHRFSLPDGALTTYDSYPERTLPDGRPLGWWFAIRIAWPNASYPSPDNLLQKMVRLHRPMQLPIDNSVAAAGIWRNILMGSRAERSLDLERLRDLINTEVKNLRQRKQLGKLSINPPRPAWEEMS